MLLALLLACAPDRLPLRAVPVSGGSALQRAIVRRELAAFDAAAGPGRLTLQRVRIGAPPGAAAGSHRAGEVVLRSTLSPSRLSETLRHELCHALDETEGLSDLRSEALLPLAARVREEIYDTPERRIREAFARLCEHGPHLGQLLRMSCEPGDEEIEPLAAWIGATVWREAEPLPGADPGLPERRVETGMALGALSLATGATEGGPRLRVWGEDGRRSVVLDPFEGTLDPDGVFSYRDADSELSAADAPRLGDLRTTEVVGPREGPGVAIVEPIVLGLGPVRRVLVREEGRWTLLRDACSPGTPFVPFLLDGHPGYARAEGSALVWRLF